MSGGNSPGGVGSGEPAIPSPVTAAQPAAPSSGEFGTHGVSPAAGKKSIPGPEGSSPADKSIRDRTSALHQLPTSEEFELPDDLAPSGQKVTDADADEAIRKIQKQQQQKSLGDNPVKPDARKVLPDSSSSSSAPSSRSATPSSRSATPSASPTSSVSSDGSTSTAASPASKPSLSVTGTPQPPEEPAPKKDGDKPVADIPPKRSFLQRHGKELSVTVVGGGVIAGGAVLSVLFPPAGLLLYSCGVMLLSMGLSKMLFALEDMPENMPKQNPEAPKSDSDKKDDSSDTSSTDDGSFTAVKKNVLDALKGAGLEAPVDEHGDIDKEKLRALQDKVKRQEQQAREEILKHSRGAELIKQVEKAAEEGVPASEIIKQAVATVCADDQSVDSDELMRAVNEVLNVTENQELMNGAMSETERETQIRAALKDFQNGLQGMDDKVLNRLYQSTQSALQMPASESTTLLLNILADMLRRELNGRALAKGDTPPAPPPPPPPPSDPGGISKKDALAEPVGRGAKPLKSTAARASAAAPVSSNADGKRVDSTKVLLQMFNFELNRAFPEAASNYGVEEADRDKLVDLAKAVETEFEDDKKSIPSMKLSEKMFLEKLKNKVQDDPKLAALVAVIEQQRADFNHSKFEAVKKVKGDR